MNNTRRYLIEERFAHLAVSAHGVVQALVADAAGHAAGRLVHGRIEVALARVVVAIAPFAGVRLTTDGRSPGQVVVEVLALLAVEALRVVRALAAAVHHVRARLDPFEGQAAGRVTVARARASDHHVVDGVVVFLLNFLPET